MKKFVSIAALTVSCFAAPSAFAGAGGGCHFHGHAPVKEALVVGCASDYKDSLASKGKIDASWKSVRLDKAETVEGKNMKEWKLTFKNPAEKDATKQTLYMFYTLTGNFIAANFTGK
ncbi:DUF6488 family protein [Rhodoferax sp.]|uniref:DUF6488 family protein n=1 Tax=Rhodoferax sp. TaxID=50421 RepID=UPI0027215895|nr:DUF6488 family protein [Rhodoferax sp.]MDO9195929.1 DUF6488 family protein [Rhodoferax sp.]